KNRWSKGMRHGFFEAVNYWKRLHDSLAAGQAQGKNCRNQRCTIGTVGSDSPAHRAEAAAGPEPVADAPSSASEVAASGRSQQWNITVPPRLLARANEVIG